MQSIKLDHRRHHPLEGDGTRQVLQPRHGGLRAQVRPAFRQPADRHLEGWAGAKRITVVGIQVAGCDEEGAKADHLRHRMAYLLRRARVLDAAGQPLGEAEPAFDLRQHQNSGIGGQAATIEGGVNRLAGDG